MVALTMWTTCSVCGRKFAAANTDAEAAAERRRNFPDDPEPRPEDLAWVCTPCYDAFLRWWEAEGRLLYRPDRDERRRGREQ